MAEADGGADVIVCVLVTYWEVPAGRGGRRRSGRIVSKFELFFIYFFLKYDLLINDCMIGGFCLNWK